MTKKGPSKVKNEAKMRERVPTKHKMKEKIDFNIFWLRKKCQVTSGTLIVLVQRAILKSTKQ
jgi:hypothetical protein